ncbi:hypothetical protein M5D96_000302 [Drosophila gunungcola]|uniref:Uncharacterized protein n=1 Tax=Drosophila gunungcola TaxID=103775 RepID=A0A9Q0BU05_9MUSC|nr:hypothetical protein M5D96_000302 [Drosophila gunungcola]
MFLALGCIKLEDTKKKKGNTKELRFMVLYLNHKNACLQLNNINCNLNTPTKFIIFL